MGYAEEMEDIRLQNSTSPTPTPPLKASAIYPPQCPCSRREHPAPPSRQRRLFGGTPRTEAAPA